MCASEQEIQRALEHWRKTAAIDDFAPTGNAGSEYVITVRSNEFTLECEGMGCTAVLSMDIKGLHISGTRQVVETTIDKVRDKVRETFDQVEYQGHPVDKRVDGDEADLTGCVLRVRLQHFLDEPDYRKAGDSLEEAAQTLERANELVKSMLPNSD
jgi:hypothetical protein